MTTNHCHESCRDFYCTGCGSAEEDLPTLVARVLRENERIPCPARLCSGGSTKHGGVCGRCDGEGYLGPTPAVIFAGYIQALFDRQAQARAAMDRLDALPEPNFDDVLVPPEMLAALTNEDS